MTTWTKREMQKQSSFIGIRALLKMTGKTAEKTEKMLKKRIAYQSDQLQMRSVFILLNGYLSIKPLFLKHLLTGFMLSGKLPSQC